MYEAPDRYKRLISARLPGGESAGLAASESESESSPLRDAQLISRAHLAPFFAAANIVAALIMAASLWTSAGSTWLVPWAGAVAAVNLGAMHLARNQAVTCVGRGRPPPHHLSPVEGRAVGRHRGGYRGAHRALRAPPFPCAAAPKCSQTLTAPQLSLSNPHVGSGTAGGCTKLQIGISA